MPDLLDLPRMVREFPIRSDESTLQLSELLHALSKHFDDCCNEQFMRAHRERRQQRNQLLRKRRPGEPHEKLPEKYDEPFSPSRGQP
jgi:hypothetical protein